MKKKWIIIVIVVIILTLGVGYFLWSAHNTSQLPPTPIIPPVTISTSIEYTNNQYDFTFTLPDDWQGYTIVTSIWNGNGNEACLLNECPPITGPEILIRNPKWTTTNKWQDIPIMIFTPDQWTDVLNASLVVSAAPIPPTELGHNSNYIFALPARYNYAFPDGWQEVNTIIQSNPLSAF